MNLKSRHIVIIIISLLLAGCAMENRSVKSADETYEMVVEDEDLDIETIDNTKVKSTINTQLINQKLQDFYDLIALQNEHPEFNKEVMEQLKVFTNDSINNFKTKDFTVIKNIRRQGDVVIVNDSVQKIKLAFDKISTNTKKTDTIYAIVTKKKIKLNNETLISNKVQFSKN